jgi:hypothetical protein
VSKLLRLSFVALTLVLAACGSTTTADAGVPIANGKDCSGATDVCASGICATQGCSSIDGGQRQICASSNCTSGSACTGGDNCVPFPGAVSYCIPACP